MTAASSIHGPVFSLEPIALFGTLFAGAIVVNCNPLYTAPELHHQLRDSCAVVVGDEVTDIMRAHPELPLMEDGTPLESLLPKMASANAYLGADVVAKAFGTGADLVITGRVADPALFLGPMLHAFGWSYEDYEKLANGTLAGHLLECSGQLTGGCFADPGVKDVEGMATWLDRKSVV